MKASYWLGCVVMFSTTVLPAIAQNPGDAALGREKAVVCLSCHGAAGMSAGPNIPHLAGQRSEYFVSSLKAYKSRNRSDPLAVLMYPFADKLSEKDMWDLAVFYESLPAAPSSRDSAEEKQ